MDNHFVWSDNWFIENGKGWFVNGWRDILCSVDLEENRCEYLAQIPNSNSNKFRLNPRCIKVGSEIFCIPDIGDSVWIYNLVSKEFKQIMIDNPYNVRLGIMDFWQFDGKLFFLASGLKKIIEVSLADKSIEQYYMISSTPEEKLARSIKVGENVYCVSMVFNKIYQFNLQTKELSVYIIPGVQGGLWTISFDGNKFWLSGFQKKIYLWNREDNTVEIIDDFPVDFGVYDFNGRERAFLNCTKENYKVQPFLESRVVGKYIWFIPLVANKILYVEKDTYIIRTFDMEAEKETKESLLEHEMACKFAVDYVLAQRYIGLYSFKNNWMVEIDTEELTTKIKRYFFDCQLMKKDMNRLESYTLFENQWFDRAMYCYLLDESVESNTIFSKQNVGNSIYNTIINNGGE